MTDECIEKIIENFSEKEGEIKRFTSNVKEFFQDISIMTNGNIPLVHSIKHRVKDKERLRRKLVRKKAEYEDVTADNFMDKITDLGGVRVLHLYHDQFNLIHEKITKQIEEKNWAFYEKPKAYTWDIELQSYFASLGLEVKINERYYTSVHYVVKPHSDSPYTCEIQVRTLFEEIWGELDHSINYPSPTNNPSQKEQLRVLAKLVGTGTTLANSIFRS
jgi:putative GTP pyrophosphokinase